MRVRSCRFLFFALPIACTSAVTGRPRPSGLPSEIPEPVQQPQLAHEWAFRYSAGVASYRITRNAAIENQSDSGTVREASSNFAHELLMLERVGDTIRFTILADTFATTTQTLAGSAQPPGLPVQLMGILIDDSLQITADTVAPPQKCSPVESALRTDLHNLLLPLPTSLLPGTRWRDSVELSGCQGMIPTVARTNRSYVVSGDTIYEGAPVIVIERSDTVQAYGEGAQQQHPLILNASGNGTALYYLNPSTGQVVRIAAEQQVILAINTSGKVHYFRQSLRQEFVLAR